MEAPNLFWSPLSADIDGLSSRLSSSSAAGSSRAVASSAVRRRNSFKNFALARSTRDKKNALTIMMSTAITSMAMQMPITTQPSAVKFLAMVTKYEVWPPASRCPSAPYKTRLASMPCPSAEALIHSGLRATFETSTSSTSPVRNLAPPAAPTVKVPPTSCRVTGALPAGTPSTYSVSLPPAAVNAT